MPITNRNKVQQFFITFPRWKQLQDLKEIPDKLPKTKWYLIVQEEHDEPDQDLNRNSMIHYHISLILSQKITFKKMLDWVTKEWPEDYKRIKVEVTKSFKASVEYCKKESKIYLEGGELPGSKTMSKKYLDLLKKYESILEYNRNNPNEFKLTRDRLEREEYERGIRFIKERYGVL